MENKLEHTCATIREFTLQLLEHITNNFSEKRIIGRGGYGVVYKGVLEDGEEIAVKKLHRMPGLDDKQFRNEFNNFMRAQHQNIVRLVGYCYDVGHERIKHNGEYIFAHVEERFLCFEYLQGGSLDKHVSDESCGLDWHSCYKIIKGVCEGLHYLHNGFNDPIYHLDLKPANILLDKGMMPKIGDFGLSRLFPWTHTYITEKIRGTWGYMPPEYINKNQITQKFDVFSLGVIIIQIMAGYEGYSKHADMSSEEFIKLVHENWRNRLHATMLSHTSQEVKRCIELALRCVETDRVKRPTIAEIVDELNKIDTTTVDELNEFDIVKSSPIGQQERRRLSMHTVDMGGAAHEDSTGELATEGYHSSDLNSPVGYYRPAAAVTAAAALRWVPYAAAVSAVRAFLGASHEDLRHGVRQLSRSLSETFFFHGTAPGQLMPPPFAARERFPEEALFVCADRPPLAPALQAVNRALMQVAVKEASHDACDWYYDTVGSLMRLLVNDEGVGRAVVDQAAFESALALEWVRE